ncbi:MAG: MFS transporter [Sphingomonas sp.]|uniref:MFS transporter n=1 Tax=Sphingomonas sp. TaxID=28214 RepID=UPI0030F8226E
MATPPGIAPPRASAYAYYVLGILFLVYVLNFVDRQIISILAEDIKRDLHLKDEDLGFLYGTAFGVFYSLFGIPLGRLADNWHRVRLMTAGLVLWSSMTALSGFARSGGMLVGARIGVGIGEATASPSAYSLISDYFPKKLRATALAIYSSGLYVGGGVSLSIAGLVVHRWNAVYPAGGPLGLHGWQAAFIAVGLPGLLLALLVATLREPVRGAVEGLPPPERHPAPFRALLADLLTIVPPFTLIGAARGGGRSLAINVLALGVVAGAIAVLRHFGEPWPQWTAVGLGAYAVFSWASALKRRDLPTYTLVIANPAFLCVVIAYGLNAFVSYGVSLWAAPYAMRTLGVTIQQAGGWIGGTLAFGGFVGVTVGGIVADRLRRRFPAGRIMVILFGAVVPLPFIVIAFRSGDVPIFVSALLVAATCSSTALGAAGATMQDLVLPRMRGTATGAFFIGTTLLGLAMGPYIAGRVSTLSGSLTTGVLSLLLTAPITIGAAIAAYRLVPRAEANREARARAAGEVIA